MKWIKKYIILGRLWNQQRPLPDRTHLAEKGKCAQNAPNERAQRSMRYTTNKTHAWHQTSELHSSSVVSMLNAKHSSPCERNSRIELRPKNRRAIKSTLLAAACKIIQSVKKKKKGFDYGANNIEGIYRNKGPNQEGGVAFAVYSSRSLPDSVPRRHFIPGI